jgi:hypothetical protein
MMCVSKNGIFHRNLTYYGLLEQQLQERDSPLRAVRADQVWRQRHAGVVKIYVLCHFHRNIYISIENALRKDLQTGS